MLSWLKRKAQKPLIKSVEEEIHQFLTVIKGFSDKEIALLLVMATDLKEKFEISAKLGEKHDKAVISALQTGIVDENNCSACWHLNQLINDNKFNKNQYAVAGLMLWFHTIRCFVIPEYRIYGKTIWEEMKRGYPYIVQIVDENDLNVNINKCKWIPPGLGD